MVNNISKKIISVIGIILSISFLIPIVMEIFNIEKPQDIDESFIYLHDINELDNHLIDCYSLNNTDLSYDYVGNTLIENNSIEVNYLEYLNNFSYFDESNNISNIKTIDIKRDSNLISYNVINNGQIANCSLTQISFQNGYKSRNIRVYMSENPIMEVSKTPSETILFQAYITNYRWSSYGLYDYVDNITSLEIDLYSVNKGKCRIYNNDGLQFETSEITLSTDLNESQYLHYWIRTSYDYSDFAIIAYNSNCSQTYINGSVLDINWFNREIYSDYSLREFDNTNSIANFTFEISNINMDSLVYWEISIESNKYYNETIISEIPTYPFDISIVSCSNSTFNFTISIYIDYYYDSDLDNYALAISQPLFIITFAIAIVYIAINKKR